MTAHNWSSWRFTLRHRQDPMQRPYVATVESVDQGLLLMGFGDSAAEAILDLLSRPDCPRGIVMQALGRDGA